jgi:hypothetical protein
MLFAEYNYNNKVKEDEMVTVCSMHGAKRNECRILVGKPERKRLLGRTRRKMEDVYMYVCIRGGPKSGPSTATFNDLLCFPF